MNNKYTMDMQEALDRVTAERDALQALLTAADERADVLEGLSADVVECLWGLELPGAGNARLRKLRAALKPAEGSTCNQIREESGLPTKYPCQACGNGACIDR